MVMKTWFVVEVPSKKRGRRLIMAKLAIVLLTICLSLMLFKAWKLSSTNNPVINKVDVGLNSSAMLGIMHRPTVSADTQQRELAPRPANSPSSNTNLELSDSLQAIRMHNTLRTFTKRGTFIQPKLSLKHEKDVLITIRPSDDPLDKVKKGSQYMIETADW